CFCECDECAKTIKESGYSGYLIKFVNELSRRVLEKYPFVKLEYLAYMHFAEPPKDDTLPDKNVITRLAHLSADLQHGVHERTNKLYLRLLREWSEITKKAGSDLYIWDYMYNIRTNYPAPLFYRLKDTVKAFNDYGVSGVFVETQNGFADMWDINNYLLSHLLEDPDLDEEVLIDDFMNRYYGKAGKYVREYTELLKKTSEKYMLKLYCVREDSPFNYIDYNAAIRGSELLEKAAEAVQGEVPFTARVNWLRKPMDAAILLKYFDLKRMAETNGVKFDFDRAVVKERVIAALKEQATLPANKTRVGSLQTEIDFFDSFALEAEEKFELPEALESEDEKNVYQFHMKNMVKFIQPYIQKAFGQSVEEDAEACGGRALKLCIDTATGYSLPYTLCPTSKDAETKKAIRLTLKKNDDIVVDTRLYKEDLIPDSYSLYKVGSVSGIAELNDVRVGFLGEGDISINLGGIAVNFPMNECEVYFSMKFTGEIYGGCAKDENAVYIDRMIVVRKN
ncbi:MAG: DUF4838 domain-containing protein, partial [Oscillospiraceae bacterium]|nr:DUF4838 domain-containing protein [Oscillospiraceae bacterium]